MTPYKNFFFFFVKTQSSFGAWDPPASRAKGWDHSDTRPSLFLIFKSYDSIH